MQDGSPTLLEHSRQRERAAAGIITDDDVMLIGDIHDATEVSLSSDHITAKSLHVLSALPRLQRLDLATTGISDDELDALRNCACLKELHLYLPSVGDAGIATIAELPQIERLRLYLVVAKEESVLQFGQLGCLKVIVLHGDSVDHKLSVALKRMLPKCVVVVEAPGLYMVEIKD